MEHLFGNRHCLAPRYRSADLSLDKHMLSEALRKSLRPTRRRELAAWFQGTYGVSCVRAYYLAQFSRAAWYRKSRAKDQTALRMRIRELAHARPRFGVLRIWVLLRHEGWPVNNQRRWVSGCDRRPTRRWPGKKPS